MEENYIWPEITKDTDPMDVIKIHEAIWDHVVRYGKKPHTPYVFNCVLCEYRDVTNSNECLCGIACRREDGIENCLHGLYIEWIRDFLKTHRGRTSVTIKIRDFFKNRKYVKNTSTKIGRELNNKLGGKNDGN